MSEQKPLSPDMRLAASRVAAGEEMKRIAADLDLNPRTVGRWMKRDDFHDLVRQHREALVGEVESAEAVARSALIARKRNGDPDWGARLAACRLLMSAPVTSPEGRREAGQVERVYIPDPDAELEDVGAPRPFPEDGARNERFQTAGEARCGRCGWTGEPRDLAAHPCDRDAEER